MSQTTSLLSPLLAQSFGERADRKTWCNLVGSSAAFALIQAANQANAPLLLITKDTSMALKYEQELQSLAGKNISVSLFPDWETLPYDSFSPHQDIISQRLATLYSIPRMQQGIVIIPINTLLQRVLPKQYLEQNSLLIKQGDKKDLHQLRTELEACGYRCVEQVMEHGEFSVRGAILDLFPMGGNQPYRFDFFDDEIDEIRLFDPESQRSTDKITNIELLPAHEFPIDPQGINLFRAQYREKLKTINDKNSVYHQVSNGILPPGVEYYLPLFFEQTQCFTDFLPEHTQLFIAGDIEQSAKQFWLDVNFRYEDRRYDPCRPLLPPAEVFFPIDELFNRLKSFNRVTLQAENKSKLSAGDHRFPLASLPDIAVNHQLKQPFTKLSEFLQHNDKAVLFVAESQGRRETLLELLKRADLLPEQVKSLDHFISSDSKLGITVNALTTGFISEQQPKLVVITEADLLGDHVRQSRRRTKQQDTNADAIFKNLAELSIGQPVVHIDHGIGRYQGLQAFENAGISTEFLTLSYANDAKLYVPVSSLHLISRYTGADTDHAPLHKLGNDNWSKTKRKAAEKIEDVAAELLEVYAKREQSQGFKYQLNILEYQAFAESFGFEPTLDQEHAINNVLNDMCSNKTMDRLVCGDVGFGKTEVAMRAAFVAANCNKQTAILVPTTLLAQQHFENFKDRFANLPVNIEVLSRFKTAKEQKAIIEKVANGQIDILVGTHKLLNQEIKYYDLGLLIVDEEHRFGVKQKEKIKSLRNNIDILTLTATPIPRTLNMAMGGMRDLSVIATAPAKRLAVKTFVRQKDEALIREAILREVLRGGQVYFLHNNVDTIDRTAQDLQTLVPEAKIVTAHGQMRERELERIMSDFYHQRFNVIVCTTIIETGIDIPSANTIIMDRADHLGLAQLHQLRGRVGRSHHQAYAYLLTPHERLMTKDAKKRLEAIASLEHLGAGFTLATHDLEIRGAGELLGEDQSGQMNQLGFSLYMDMLDQAVKALQAGKSPSLENLNSQHSEVELKIPALLPDDYIHDVSIRLSQYKRIASCANDSELDELQVELIDRFGLLPQPAKNLFQVAKLKLKAQHIGITRIDVGPKGGVIEFSDDTKVDPTLLIGLIQAQPAVYKLDGANKLKFVISTDGAQARITLITSMLSDLTGKRH